MAFAESKHDVGLVGDELGVAVCRYKFVGVQRKVGIAYSEVFGGDGAGFFVDEGVAHY